MKKFKSKKKVAMQLWRFPKTTLFIVMLLAGSFSLTAQNVRGTIWQDVSESAIVADRTTRVIIPDVYRTMAINRLALSAALEDAPMEFTEQARTSPLILSFPMPDGTFENYRVYESLIMEPALAQKYSSIKTYAGRSVNDDKASMRFDVTDLGFNAIFFTSKGVVHIEPYTKGNLNFCTIFYRKDVQIPPDLNLSCEVEDIGQLYYKSPGSVLKTGANLRTFRLAVAATGEYTAFYGGTRALGQAAIVTAMNLVNALYERDVAVRMILIGNNDTLVYTNAGTDPFTNPSSAPCGGPTRGENVSNTSTIIGDANFDIGHVFTGFNIGGCAAISGVCVNTDKARAASGVGYGGGIFEMGLTAHEMGHQFGANHTFNSDAGTCAVAGGQHTATSAYEPGSGTSIMSYAGACAPDMIAGGRDMFFHTHSYSQMESFILVGSGSGCVSNVASGNGEPTSNAGAGGQTIPISTPFALTGSGSDPDGNGSLTYTWEQYDLGPAGAPNSPSGNAPLFRFFPPTTSTTRTFPQLSDLLNNTQTMGEILPSYGRNLSFRFVVRDNNAGCGGTDFDTRSFAVSAAAGPFLVTAPNTNVMWCAGTSQTVTWNVAGTDVAPVNTAAVRILLSTDGGNTFPIVLHANTPNDGSANITVPNNPVNNNARVKVEAIGNIYFDISNVNFTINAAPVVTLHPQSQAKEWGDNVTFTATATGTPTPSRQWQISTDGGANFANIPGETGTSLTLTCLTLAENNNQYRIGYTNVCGVIYSNAATLTVTPRTTTATLTVTPNPQQYSDLVTFYVLLENANICGEVAATDVSFYIGTQFFGTVALTVNGDDLEATLANQALLEPSPMGTPPVGQMAPGIHDAIAVFSGSNSNFTVTNDTIDMTIEKEDARAYYTGACFASTLGVSNCNAVVTLSATIKDITAVVGDPDYDPNAGDIRYATLSFINRATNTVIASNVPIGLVSMLDKTIAVGTYNWNVCIAGNSQTFEIGIIVDGYYTRNSSADNVLVTVSKPVGNFVTGGGYIILANSAGVVAGDAGTKSNFGFNTKFNQQGSNLQGNVNVLVRRTETDGVLHTYKIKSNVFTSLGIQKETWGGKSTINSKAIVQDITDPNNIVAIFGNGSMQIKFTDRGEPGTSDSIAITIWNKQGGLWYSSNWNSTSTVEQILDGGNLKINSNNSYVLRETDPVTENTKGITVYPNPAMGTFQLSVNPESGTHHQLAIFDIYGKQVFAANLNDESGTGTFDIDLTGHAAGIYLIRLSTGSEVQFLKMMME